MKSSSNRTVDAEKSNTDGHRLGVTADVGLNKTHKLRDSVTAMN